LSLTVFHLFFPLFLILNSLSRNFLTSEPFIVFKKLIVLIIDLKQLIFQVWILICLSDLLFHCFGLVFDRLFQKRLFLYIRFFLKAILRKWGYMRVFRYFCPHVFFKETIFLCDSKVFRGLFAEEAVVFRLIQKSWNLDAFIVQNSVLRLLRVVKRFVWALIAKKWMLLESLDFQ